MQSRELWHNNAGPVPEREAVGNDLNPAFVMLDGLDIEVPDKDMLMDGGAGFPAGRQIRGVPKRRDPERSGWP